MKSGCIRSVQIYDLRGNYARGRVQVRPPEATCAEMRRLLGYTHHEVADFFKIVTVPQDLEAAHVLPILLLRHEDLLFGDNRRAILVDVLLQGTSYDSIIETDRYTILLPQTIHREQLDSSSVHGSCVLL